MVWNPFLAPFSGSLASELFPDGRIVPFIQISRSQQIAASRRLGLSRIPAPPSS
jgi:hypothetical protein